MADVAFYAFSERRAGLLPSDRAGQFDDLRPESPQVAPTATADDARTLTGVGAVFGYGTAVAAVPLAGATPWAGAGDERDTGIAAVIWWDFAAQYSSGGGATLVSIGGEGPQVRIALELEPLDLVLRTAQMWLRWQTSGGTLIAAAPFEFRVPEEPFAIYVSREYTAAGLVVRYAAAGLDGGAVVVAELDVDTTPTTLHVGGAPGGGGSYARHFRGVVDLLQVVARPIAEVEAAASSDRLTRIAPATYAAIRALDQPGIHPSDPSTLVQRELQVEAAAWASVREATTLLRRSWYPARAFGEQLELWEASLALPPPGGAGLQERRDRLMRRWRETWGVSPVDVAARLAGALDCTAAQLAVLEPDNVLTETFDPPTLSGGYLVSGYNARSWISIDEGAGSITAPSGGNDWIRLALPASSHDARYKGAAVASDHVHVLRSIGSAHRVRVDLVVRAMTVPTGHAAGVVFGSRVTDRWLWIGVVDIGAGDRLAAVEYSPIPDIGITDGRYGRITLGAELLDLGAAPATPFKLRIEHGVDAAGVANRAAWRVRSTTGTLNSATPVDVLLNPIGRWPVLDAAAAEWIGFGVIALGDTVSSSAAAQLDVSDVVITAASSPARFSWAVYRDPVIGGTPDVRGARVELERFAPLHTRGTVLERLGGIYTNDAATRLDRDRLGS